MAGTQLLSALEHFNALDSNAPCFYMAGGLEDSPETYSTISYAQLRERSSRLARAIERAGIGRGAWCVADMGNCEAFVYLLLAAAMGGFSVVAMNERLASLEKDKQLREAGVALCAEKLPVFSEKAVIAAIRADSEFDSVETLDPARWIRKGAGAFNAAADAVALYSSGRSGRPKIVALSWENLLNSAVGFNSALNSTGRGLWQLAQPLYQAGALQVALASLLNGSPFMLYRSFNAEQLLRDVDALGASHVSVSWRMLNDLLNLDQRQAKELNVQLPVALQIDEDEFEPDEGSGQMKTVLVPQKSPQARDGLQKLAALQMEQPQAQAAASGEGPSLGEDSQGPADGASGEGSNGKGSQAADTEAESSATEGAAAAESSEEAPDAVEAAEEGLLQDVFEDEDAFEPDEGLGLFEKKGISPHRENKALGHLPSIQTSVETYVKEEVDEELRLDDDSAVKVLYREQVEWKPEAAADEAALEGAAAEGDAGAAQAAKPRPLSKYRCILFGETALCAANLKRIEAAGAKVYASFGLTETAGRVAAKRVERGYDGTLEPLPGCKLAVIAPDAHGYGKLAVGGPSVMFDYLNSHASFTADGFLLTSTQACANGKNVRFVDSLQDMFVCDGEEIYPNDIRQKLLQVPGVSDAFVFAQEDPKWGYRPAAVVEAANVSREANFNLQLFTNDIRLSLASRLSPEHCPERIIVVPEFPHSGVGGIDVEQLRLLYDQRIDVQKVEIWRVRLPLKHSVKLGGNQVQQRETLLLRLTDWAGRTGVGECSAFVGKSYLPETLESSLRALQDSIVPLASDYVFVHPSQASVLFRAVPESAAAPQACAAVEGALWDLYGKIVHRSVAKLIGGRDCVSEAGSLHGVARGCAPAGAVVSASRRDALAQVRAAVEAGYTRVRVQLRPGHDVEPLAAIRKEFPQLVLVADCGQHYTEDDMELLQQIDNLHPACIVDPLDPQHLPKVGPQGFWERLVRVQRDFSAPVCLDECWTTVDDLKYNLEKNPSLRCVCLKLGKMGGVQCALEFCWWARNRGISLWMGDVCETGVSKRLHAAFAMLPGMNLPGDLFSTEDLLQHDPARPPFVAEGGAARVNPQECRYGTGCNLDLDAMAPYVLQHLEIAR